jgi:choline dehydrogenase
MITANYLSDRRDREISIAALREVRPGPEADEALLEHIARLGATSYHPIGTCKMGKDPLAVVDHELRVHGIEGLRAADASVMPTMVSSNTKAPSFLIGERCADFVLRDAGVNVAPEIL